MTLAGTLVVYRQIWKSGKWKVELTLPKLSDEDFKRLRKAEEAGYRVTVNFEVLE